MFDMMMGIDRRMKYLNGALAAKSLTPQGGFTDEERIERLGVLLPELEHLAAPDTPSALDARERLSRIQKLFSGARQRRLAIEGTTQAA
jgi:hypothetical protein